MPSNNSIATTNVGPSAPSTVNQRGNESVTPTDKGSDVAVNPNRGVHRGRSTRTVSSEDLSVRGTEVISQSDSNQAYVPNRPVEFALQNERGKTRKISLPPVSFGAQNLIGSNRPTDVKYTETSRVW